MLFFARLRNRTHRGRALHRPAVPGFRPRLEALEDRCVLSTLNVINNLDSGAGSLRAEIAAANSGDTIAFDPGLNGQTITLTGGELVINKNLTIQGPGASQLTISGNYQTFNPTAVSCRVFDVEGVTATIAGLTISNGFAFLNDPGGGGGGGILNHGGHLTVSSCTLSNNRASIGGGIANTSRGSLTVSGCTLSGNQFTAREGNMGGGGIYNAVGATATVTASIISGNHGPQFTGQSNGDGSEGDGGGIYNGGWMTLSACMATNNSPYLFGGGIFEDRFAHLSILNKSVVSNNRPGGDLFLAFGAGPVTISSDSSIGVIVRG